MPSLKKKIQLEEIEIPEKVIIHSALNNKVKSAQFNLIFPDGKAGALTISKIKGTNWNPSEDIQSITIKWIR